MIFKKKIQSNPEIYAVPAVEKVNLFEQPLFHLKLITSEYFKVIYTLYLLNEFFKNPFFLYYFLFLDYYFFLIFSPVKFFSRKFVLKLSTIWTGSVIKLAKNILKIDYEISGLKNIPKKNCFCL